MLRLDGSSASFIYNDLPNWFQHTLKVAFLDWSESSEEYSFTRLRSMFAENIEELYPVLKWKIRMVPFGLNHPVWVYDRDFHIDNHLFRIACPLPGDDEALDKLISQLYAHTMDKNLPLWQMWVIEGLASGQVAIVTLFHHAISDGVGAGNLLLTLAKSRLENQNIVHHDSRYYGVDPDYHPSDIELLIKGIIDLPMLFVRSVPKAISSMRRLKKLKQEMLSAGKALPPEGSQTPESPFNTEGSNRRTFAHINYELSRIKQLSRAFNVTINDIFIALGTGAVRRFYFDNGLPVSQKLVASIPINIRAEEQKHEITGNYLSNAFTWVPIHIDDPIERLKSITNETKIMKSFISETKSASLMYLYGLLHPITFKLIYHLVRKVHGQTKLVGNLALSNVPGPSEELVTAGAKIVKWLSIGQVTTGIGLNLTAWSFNGQFSICLMADAAVLEDGHKFLHYLNDALMEYEQLASDGNLNEPLPGETASLVS